MLRLGARGEAVRDLQARLRAGGYHVAIDGTLDARTEQAVREFQAARGLRVDGICGPETWGALIESGFVLGDRLLQLRAPMLRGDDVTELQRRLNALGFDAGREDGIFGPHTERAVQAFQRNAGIASDGVCGPGTLNVLEQVGGLAAGSVAHVRERDLLLREAHHLQGRRMFVVSDPELASLATTMVRALRNLGARIVADTSGADAGVLAAEANRFGAVTFVALIHGAEPGARCAYFANKSFRSEGGYCLARRLTETLRPVLPEIAPPIGRTYRLLRDTRMAAVVCELLGPDEPEATAALRANEAAVAHALVEGVRRGVEEPVDVSC